MPHCTNKRCHVDSTCMTNLFNQVFVIGKFSRMYPTEQIDQTIDLGKLIKLTDRTIGQSYFLNGRTCTLESIQVLNFRLGIQMWQQFWTLHNKNGLWFVSIAQCLASYPGDPEKFLLRGNLMLNILLICLNKIIKAVQFLKIMCQ